mgnify:CR=1 FL=1
MEGKTARLIARKTTGFMVLTMVIASIAYYFPRIKTPCHNVLYVLAFLLPIAAAVSSIWGLTRVRSALDKRRMLMNSSVGLVSTILISVVPILLLTHTLPGICWPWILPASVLFLPRLAAKAHQKLQEPEEWLLIKYLTIAAGAGFATWLQIILAHSLHTWLLVVIGVIPIPLLALSAGVTFIVALYCVIVVLSAAIYSPLKRIYGIK